MTKSQRKSELRLGDALLIGSNGRRGGPYVIHAASSIIRSSCLVEVLESIGLLVFIPIKAEQLPRSPPD
jgi:hypothetical protein